VIVARAGGHMPNVTKFVVARPTMLGRFEMSNRIRTGEKLRDSANSLLACFLVLCICALGFCTMPSAAAAPAADQAAGARDYTIGPGDVLTITVVDAPEFGGKVRVGDSGAIEVVGLSQPVTADGKSAAQLSGDIRQALVDAKQLRDPQISVFVDEYHGRTVTVLGAVNKPAVYSLQRKTMLLEAISAAGGALPNSGNTATIVRGPASAEATETHAGSVQIVNLSRLATGDDLSANVEVRNGDIISVSAAQMVYVVGAVIKPGGFVLANPEEGISASQAVALAQGFTSVASTHRALIVRQSTSDHARVEIPVDLERMMEGQQTDVLLAPNDILFVPESGAKKTLKVMGDVAMATVNGIAIYGVGYKIGTSY
jgi:polysaccharide export outer membrane protein